MILIKCIDAVIEVVQVRHNTMIVINLTKDEITKKMKFIVHVRCSHFARNNILRTCLAVANQTYAIIEIHRNCNTAKHLNFLKVNV